MRVVCDNCGAVYKIPESKLQREVNKATCRKCGHGIIIRKMGSGALSATPQPADGEATQITSADELEARARAQQTAAAGMPSVGFPPFGGRDLPLSEEVIPPTVVEQRPDSHEQTVPRAGRGAPGPIIESPSRPMPISAAPPVSLPPPPALPSAGQTLIPMASPLASPPPAAPAPPLVALPPVQAPAAAFDPSGDMTLVMMGCFGGLVGSAVLATATGSLVSAIGLAICVGSAITSLLVLVTGDRGRKEAKVFLSMLMALFLAGGAGGAWYALSAASSGLFDQLASLELPTEPLRPTVEGPAGVVGETLGTPPEEPKDDGLAELVGADTAVEPKTEPEGDEPKPQPTAIVKTSPSEPRTEPKTQPKTEPKTQPKTEPKTQPKTEPKTQPKTEPKPSGSQGVPVTVLDTMLKSNKGVKRCFGIYRQETGALPSGRITVELTVQPSGKATHAKIDGGAYAGTSLDSCLSGAIKDITFPPWDGSEGLTYYYPFIMN